MLVKKRLNNNVVLAVTTYNADDEQVLIGKGLGFQVYPGDVIADEKIQQVFLPSEQVSITKMAASLTDASYEDVQLVERIVAVGEQALEQKLGQGILFSLLDHLLYAFQRYTENMTIKSPLEWEIRQFYAKELAVGKKALNVIQQERGLQLPESEAVFIALHFINYEYEHESMDATMDYMEVIKDISKLIQFHFQVNLDEQSVNYQRFLNHLRYYVIRVQQKDHASNMLDNEELVYTVKRKYPKEYQTSLAISQYLEERYHTQTGLDENLYLTLHLVRLLTDN